MKLTLLAPILYTLTFLNPAPANAQQPGKFDYYLLSMSWSPEFCYSHPDSPECGKHLGLVVHGLWPQYDGAGRGPEDCGNQPGPANPDSLLDMIPTASLIQHEWTTHGTCSGLSASEYFGLMRRIYSNFRVPQELDHPRRQFFIRAYALKRDIEQANPGLNDSEIALTCAGPYLREIQLCVSKDGRPQPCSALRECHAGTIRIPAVR